MIWRLLALLIIGPLITVALDLAIMRPFGFPFALRLGIALTLGLIIGIVGGEAVLRSQGVKMIDGEKGLEQMLVELGERWMDVELATGSDRQWTLTACNPKRSQIKFYIGTTPHSAVVQAYRDR